MHPTITPCFSHELEKPYGRHEPIIDRNDDYYGVYKSAYATKSEAYDKRLDAHSFEFRGPNSRPDFTKEQKPSIHFIDEGENANGKMFRVISTLLSFG